MNRLLILLFIFIDVNVLFSQETLSDTYTPSGNGYIMTVPFEFKFINCIGSDGIPHLSVGKITKNAVSNKYKYNGKIYTEEDLGSESFSNMTKYIGYTDIEVVIWDGNWQLGTVKLTNVTGYNVGCQGQLYDVFKKLGINGKEYKEKINLLSIGDIRIIKVSNSDAGLEMKIKDYDKNNKIKSLIDDANYSFSYMRYEDAENICNEIKKIDYSNARANEILEKIKIIRKEETKKLDYNQFISKGDNYYAKKDFTNAIQEYKSALNTGYDNEKAQSKVREAETAEEKNNDLKEKEEGKEEVEVEKPELGKIQTQQKENKSNDKETEVDDLEEFNRKKAEEDTKRAIENASKSKSLSQLMQEADDMRANGKTNTSKYIRTLQEIKNAEESIGISGMDSYASKLAMNDASNKMATALSGFAGAIAEGSIGSLSFRVSQRKLINGKDSKSLNPITYEVGMFGDGGIGFFLGFGTQSEGESGEITLMGGMEINIINLKKWGSIGLGFEVGKGSYNSGYIDFEEEFLRGSERNIEEAWFYSPSLYVKLFRYVYLSYNYGYAHITQEQYINYRYPSERENERFKSKFKEPYSTLRVGLNIPF